MNITEVKNDELVVFKPENGNTEFQVVLDSERDTVWVTEQQIIDLFGKSRRTIGEHIKNIFAEGELDKESTWRESRQVQKEGEREVSRKVAIYNLDVIISVGYRVKSKVGIEFRKWATSKLKEYLLKGYSINKILLEGQQSRIIELEQTLNKLHDHAIQEQKILTEGFLSIITQYSKSFELLSKYDSEQLSTEGLSSEIIYVINYPDVVEAIQKLKQNLIEKGEASRANAS